MGKKHNNKSSTDSKNKSAGVNTSTELVPEEFKRVIYDFINDFSITFPEYSDKLEDHFTMVSVVNDDGSGEKTERIITDDNNKKLYEYCKSVYPSRFFDILYKNGDIFKATNDNVGGGVGGEGGGDDLDKIDAYFLPNIDFIKVWNTPDISDNTRNTIWKYLQLILFSIITNISDRDSFGETAKLFEAINEDELKTKLEETFKNMQDMFMGAGAGTGTGTGAGGSKSGETGEAGENTKFDIPDMKEFEKFAEHFKNFSGENGDIDMSSFPGFPGFPGFDFKNASQSSGAGGGDASAEDGSKKQPDIPNPEAIHEHISKLLNGKIGSLAKEIAEETAGDLDLGVDFDNPENINMGNVFQKLFKNPGKLMNMVKNVGKKLDDKFKNGDIKESEIMQEASEMLSNMKNMPGMGNLSSMLNQLGMSGLGGLGGLAGLAGLGGKGGKVNMGALQSHFQQNMKQAKMKERMQSKLQQRQQQQQQQPAQAQASVSSTQPPQVRPTTSVFKAGEQIQQTPRPMGGVGLPASQSETSTDNKMFTADNADNTDVAHKKKKKKNKNKK